MKRNIKSLLKFFLLSAVTVVFTVLLFRIFKASNPAGFESAVPAKGELLIAKGVEPLGPVEVSRNDCVMFIQWTILTIILGSYISE